MAEVEGTLTLEGKPLDQPQVQFIPDPENGTIATTCLHGIAKQRSRQLTTPAGRVLMSVIRCRRGACCAGAGWRNSPVRG